MRGVVNDPVRVGGSVTRSELEVTAPQGVAEIPAPLAVNQPGIEPASAALPAFRATVEHAACGGHCDTSDPARAHGRPGVPVLAHSTPPTRFARRPRGRDPLSRPPTLTALPPH